MSEEIINNIDIIRKYSIGFCNWILSIEDSELKKIKNPEELFNKYIQSL
jgi:hypothetical protein